MSEEMIIQHCAPTLAGMKTGNLFTCPYQAKKELQKEIRHLNRLLASRGIRVLPIKYYEQKVLIYLYRPSYLKRDFSNRDTVSLLGDYGYDAGKPERCLVRLMERLRENREFPHEIGLFLGYPPEDVRGFIENRAGNCKCTGYWKVYGDEEGAKRLFGKYKKCTDIYDSNWVRGEGMERLAVAV